MHEANRVYGDKLVDGSDLENYEKLVLDTIKKGGFEDLDEGELFSKPLIYCHFAEGIGEAKYLPVRSWEQLTKILREKGIQVPVGLIDLSLFAYKFINVGYTKFI
jgi:dynein heavy chain